MSLGFKGFRDEEADKKSSRQDTMLMAAAGCEDYGLFNKDQMAIIRAAIDLHRKRDELITITYCKVPGRKKRDVRFVWNITFEKEFTGDVD